MYHCPHFMSRKWRCSIFRVIFLLFSLTDTKLNPYTDQNHSLLSGGLPSYDKYNFIPEARYHSDYCSVFCSLCTMRYRFHPSGRYFFCPDLCRHAPPFFSNADAKADEYRSSFFCASAPFLSNMQTSRSSLHLILCSSKAC